MLQISVSHFVPIAYTAPRCVISGKTLTYYCKHGGSGPVKIPAMGAAGRPRNYAKSFRERTGRNPKIIARPSVSSAPCSKIFVCTNIVIYECIQGRNIWIVELIKDTDVSATPRGWRIIHLLTRGPLCVCHFQEISRPCANEGFPAFITYFRKKGIVEIPARDMDDLQPSVKTSARAGSQSQMPSRLCAPTDTRFRADLKALPKVRADCGWIDEALENKRTCTCHRSP